MNPMKRLLPLLLLIPLYAYAAVPAAGHAAALQRVSDTTVSLEQAVAQVQAEHGGRILAAETVVEQGKAVHVIKLLTPTHSVRTVRVPADSER